MLYSLFCELTIVLYTLKSALSYELVQKLPLGMGSLDIESIEWDSTNKQYLIASWYFGTIVPFSQDAIDDADYNLTDTKYNTVFPGPNGQLFPINIWRNPINSGGAGTAGTAFNNGAFKPNTSNWRPAGMEIINGKLYVVDFYFGRVAVWDIQTSTFSNSILITNTDGKPANLDGLCHDPENYNILYATDFGYDVDDSGDFQPTGHQAVYSVNTNDWSWKRIYDTSTTVEGAENGYTIRPNGCIVVDGVLYTVDSDLKHTQKQGWSMYNIANNKWKVKYDILPETGGDGLVYIDVIGTFFTTDFENGTLSKYNPKKDSKFVVVYEGMNSPADMTYNEEERILAIPEVYTGFVNFIELNDGLFATTTQYFTTGVVDSGSMIQFIACILSLFMVLIV